MGCADSHAGNERRHDCRTAANVDRLNLQSLKFEEPPRQGNPHGEFTVPGEGDEATPKDFSCARIIPGEAAKLPTMETAARPTKKHLIEEIPSHDARDLSYY